MTICLKRIAGEIPKATDIHSAYVIIALPRPQCLPERAWLLRYTLHCLCCYIRCFLWDATVQRWNSMMKSESYYRQSVTYSEMDAPGLTVLWPNCETRRARAWASCNAKPSSVCHPSLSPSLTHFEVSLPIFFYSAAVVLCTWLCEVPALLLFVAMAFCVWLLNRYFCRVYTNLVSGGWRVVKNVRVGGELVSQGIKVTWRAMHVWP